MVYIAQQNICDNTSIPRRLQKQEQSTIWFYCCLESSPTVDPTFAKRFGLWYRWSQEFGWNRDIICRSVAQCGGVFYVLTSCCWIEFEWISLLMERPGDPILVSAFMQESTWEDARHGSVQHEVSQTFCFCHHLDKNKPILLRIARFNYDHTIAFQVGTVFNIFWCFSCALHSYVHHA